MKTFVKREVFVILSYDELREVVVDFVLREENKEDTLELSIDDVTIAAVYGAVEKPLNAAVALVVCDRKQRTIEDNKGNDPWDKDKEYEG